MKISPLLRPETSLMLWVKYAFNALKRKVTSFQISALRLTQQQFSVTSILSLLSDRSLNTQALLELMLDSCVKHNTDQSKGTKLSLSLSLSLPFFSFSQCQQQCDLNPQVRTFFPFHFSKVAHPQGKSFYD